VIHWEAVIERVWRCTWRPGWSELRAALGGRDRSSLEMHVEPKIERVGRCAWSRRSSELRDAHSGCDRASLEIHLQAMIERDWRSTWRWSIWRQSVGGAPGAETLFIG
jgi:hypothetical protein